MVTAISQHKPIRAKEHRNISAVKMYGLGSKILTYPLKAIFMRAKNMTNIDAWAVEKPMSLVHRLRFNRLMLFFSLSMLKTQ